SASDREIARRERDQDRGYSINVKQVVLAFAVEFFIIGLILVGQYLIAEEAAKERVFAILLFPIGMAGGELGRVPLAVSVRTQNSWSVKSFAALGVAAAVVVTSFSLSTIAYQTFDPRLAEANQKNNTLQNLRSNKAILEREIVSATQVAEQKRVDRDNVNRTSLDLQSQMSKLTTAKGNTCTTTTNADGSKTERCSPTNVENKAQKNMLQTQLDITKKELDVQEGALTAANVTRANIEGNLRPIDQKITAAEDDYRVAVARSQLHSYTSMIKGKAPTEVTDAEIKSLESYLIFIPSIAAALASTLLAITAVRRIRPRPETIATIPDDAATYLFGPLVEAIKKQAEEAVAAAMADKAKSTGPPQAASA